MRLRFINIVARQSTKAGGAGGGGGGDSASVKLILFNSHPQS